MGPFRRFLLMRAFNTARTVMPANLLFVWHISPLAQDHNNVTPQARHITEAGATAVFLRGGQACTQVRRAVGG
jgi:hypothetical protein